MNDFETQLKNFNRLDSPVNDTVYRMLLESHKAAIAQAVEEERERCIEAIVAKRIKNHNDTVRRDTRPIPWAMTNTTFTEAVMAIRALEVDNG